MASHGFMVKFMLVLLRLCWAHLVDGHSSPSRGATTSATCAPRSDAPHKDTSLIQVSGIEAQLQRHAKSRAFSMLASTDATCAKQIRELHSGPEEVGRSLLAGLQAIQASVAKFTQSPPDIAGGISMLGTELLRAVETLIPDSMKNATDLVSFRVVWMDTFTGLPTTVRSINDGIEDFATYGEHQKLIDALGTVIEHATTAITTFVPEETAAELVRYMEAVTDLLNGVGQGLTAFDNGDTTGAVEGVYNGLRAATDDLVPSVVQDDPAYQAVVGVLDVALGNLTKHVMEYRQLLAHSKVCWRGFVGRDHERPSVCEGKDYTWDGKQWCLYKQVEPYTIESVSAASRFLNVYRGGVVDGTNVQVWNNPESEHSQWRIHGPSEDGSYTLQNVAGGLYLGVQEGSTRDGANVQGSKNPFSIQNQWYLQPTGAEGIFTVRNKYSNNSVNLDCYWCLGANVQMSTDLSSPGNQWHIVSAWHHVPLQSLTDREIALMDKTVAAKRPQGALPARCPNGLEKRGSWCYKACPAGYQSAGPRCKAECATSYPSNSAMMCGKSDGDISAVFLRMVVGSVRQVATIAGLIMAMQANGLLIAVGLRGTMQALIDLGKPFAHPSCPVTQSARRATDTVLMQVSDIEKALQRHASPKTVPMLASIDATCARHIHELHRTPEQVGQSLLEGVHAIQASVQMFMQSPPDIAGGVSTMATQLLSAVERILPEDLTSGETFPAFRTAWMDTFVALPSTVERIKEDLESFADEGEPHLLVDAIETILTNATVAIIRFVPEETGSALAEYMAAIVDVFDGLGNALTSFANGDTPGAVELMYNGLRAAASGLVPSELQNDTTYQAVVGLLDNTLGNLSQHVLEFRHAIVNARVCYRNSMTREYERPHVCPANYVWDGAQYCLYREVEPYTIESVTTDSRYLNVHNGRANDGANVQVWNNPGSDHTQWRIHGPAEDGSYTVQNVAGGLYLNVQEGGTADSANVQGSKNPSSRRSHWYLQSIGPAGVYRFENIHSGTFLNLDCYWCLGANVRMSTNSSSSGNQWRIVSAWRHAPFESQTATAATGVALLDKAVAKKRPQNALPATCSGNLEKIGAWCYKACPAGYRADADSCTPECGPDYPIESSNLCGKGHGDITAYTVQAAVAIGTQAMTVWNLFEDMSENGMHVAEGLSGTVQALIDVGRAFAAPLCIA